MANSKKLIITFNPTNAIISEKNEKNIPYWVQKNKKVLFWHSFFLINIKESTWTWVEIWSFWISLPLFSETLLLSVFLYNPINLYAQEKTMHIDTNPQNIEDISLNGYVNTFVASAVRTSIETFIQFGFYFFSNTKTSTFKDEEIEKAEYFAIWNDYNLRHHDFSKENKYVQPEFIGKIVFRWCFSIEHNKKEVTKILPLKKLSEWISEETILNTMNFFLENTYFVKLDNTFMESTPKEWRFIYVNPKNILEYNEDILLPQKKTVPLDLHYTRKWKIIPYSKLVGLQRINDEVSLKESDCTIFIHKENRYIDIWNGNKVYMYIIKNLIWKDEVSISEFSWSNYANLTHLEKNFNKANFAKYLGYKIEIDKKRKIISKVL